MRSLREACTTKIAAPSKGYERGYYLVASDGGVFAFGSAPYHGSMGGTRLNSPMVGMAEHPSRQGYYTVAADGGIFTFPDRSPTVKFYGSMGGTRLNKPIVGMAAHPSGLSYWLVAADGGIFTFPDKTSTVKYAKWRGVLVDRGQWEGVRLRRGS